MKLDAPEVTIFTNMQHTHASAAQGGTVAAADIASGAALSKTDDTNVILTLGGTPLTALLKAASITVTWSGLLAPTRGGTGVANNDAMTVTGAGNFAYTRTLTGVTNVTFPTTGTLATLAGSEALTNKTLTAPVLSGTMTGTATPVIGGAIVVNTTGNITGAAITSNGGNGNQLTLGNTGERFTQITFNNNGVAKGHLWYDLTTTRMHLNAIAGSTVALSVNSVVISSVSSTGLAVTGAISATTTINGALNGTLGATTPAAVTATTVTATGNISAGTANLSYVQIGPTAGTFGNRITTFAGNTVLGVDTGKTFFVTTLTGGNIADFTSTGLAVTGSTTTSTGFGCNGNAAQTKYTVNAASTDLATVVALCNQLRAALVANGVAL